MLQLVQVHHERQSEVAHHHGNPGIEGYKKTQGNHVGSALSTCNQPNAAYTSVAKTNAIHSGVAPSPYAPASIAPKNSTVMATATVNCPTASKGGWAEWGGRCVRQEHKRQQSDRSVDEEVPAPVQRYQLRQRGCDTTSHRG